MSTKRIKGTGKTRKQLKRERLKKNRQLKLNRLKQEQEQDQKQKEAEKEKALKSGDTEKFVKLMNE